MVQVKVGNTVKNENLAISKCAMTAITKTNSEQ